MSILNFIIDIILCKFLARIVREKMQVKRPTVKQVFARELFFCCFGFVGWGLIGWVVGEVFGCWGELIVKERESCLFFLNWQVIASSSSSYQKIKTCQEINCG